MILDVSDNSDYSISFEQFRAMRVLSIPCEINILAEYKKFDIHKLLRGTVTEDCLRKVLKADGLKGEELETKVRKYMNYDSNADGKLSFRDFH
jgi:hypothetical protein